MKTGSRSCIAFVIFDSGADADLAIRMLHSCDFYGYRLTVRVEPSVETGEGCGFGNRDHQREGYNDRDRDRALRLKF